MDKILNDMQSFGIMPESLIPDGRIHRCKSNSKSKQNKDGWYVVKQFDDNFYAYFGCWIKGESQRSSSNSDNINNTGLWEELQQIYEYEKEERRESGIKKATEFISNCVPAIDHQYLVNKCISPHGALMHDDKLIIPVYDKSGNVTSYQSIDPFGKKRFMPGGAVGGGCFPIPGNGKHPPPTTPPDMNFFYPNGSID